MHLLHFKEHLALLTVSIIYGVNYVVVKEVMPAYILPKGFILWRVMSAVVFFSIVAGIIPAEKIRRQDWLRLFLCGMTGVAFNQLLFFEGLNLTTPINASLVMITTPISVLLLDRLLNQESITFNKIMGIVAGVVGALLIIFGREDFALHRSGAMGDFLVFLNASFYAAYLVLVKPLMKHYHPITVMKWVFIFGLLAVLPAGWREAMLIEWEHFDIKIWTCFLFVLICTTIVAYSLNIYAMKQASPSLVGMYIYVQPLVATAIAIVYGKDTLTWVKMIAGLLIFTGVYLAGTPQGKQLPDQNA